MAMTFAQLKTFVNLTTDNVMSVYSGRDGKCCCGCAGNHRYNSKHREAATKNRGYAVDDDDINDKQVKRVLTLLQDNYQHVEAGGNHFSLVVGERIYVVYPLRTA